MEGLGKLRFLRWKENIWFGNAVCVASPRQCFQWACECHDSCEKGALIHIWTCCVLAHIVVGARWGCAMDFQTETPRCLEPLRAFGTRFAEVQHQKAVVNLTRSRHIKPLVSQKDPGSVYIPPFMRHPEKKWLGMGWVRDEWNLELPIGQFGHPLLSHPRLPFASRKLSFVALRKVVVGLSMQMKADEGFNFHTWRSIRVWLANAGINWYFLGWKRGARVAAGFRGFVLR